jgi:predicted dehydrogenase
MTLGISEGWAMIDAAREHGITFQVGSQQRSAPEFRKAAEIIRNGILGECRSCTIGLC